MQFYKFFSYTSTVYLGSFVLAFYVVWNSGGKYTANFWEQNWGEISVFFLWQPEVSNFYCNFLLSQTLNSCTGGSQDSVYLNK